MEAQALLGYVYAVADRKDHSEDIFRKLQEQSKREYMPSSYLAMIYMGLGKKDCALPLLEKGYEEHDQGVNLLWDSLRSDPRYADLLRRMGLPQ